MPRDMSKIRNIGIAAHIDEPVTNLACLRHQESIGSAVYRAAMPGG